MLEKLVGRARHVMWLYLPCFDFSATKKEYMHFVYRMNQNETSHKAGQAGFVFFFLRGLFRCYLDFFFEEKDELYSAVPQL